MRLPLVGLLTVLAALAIEKYASSRRKVCELAYLSACRES
jgi:hypothetical protein